MIAPITPAEDLTALADMIAAERAALARLKRQIAVHRLVLQSPDATITELEAQAIKIVSVVEYLETERAALVPATQ